MLKASKYISRKVDLAILFRVEKENKEDPNFRKVMIATIIGDG